MPFLHKRSNPMEDAGRSWGFIATNVPDPPACISECRSQFLESLSPDDETLRRVCEILSDTDHADREQPLQTLYCCDSQACGVDHLDEAGQDPNVNWLKNACHNIGFEAIVDHGPPASNYTCSCMSAQAKSSSCSGDIPSRPSIAAWGRKSQSLSSETTATSSPSYTPVQSNIITTATSTTATGLAPISSYSALHDPSLVAEADRNNHDDNSRSTGLPTGITVTIAMSTVVGALLITALVICLLRPKWRSRRRKQEDGSKTSPSPSPGSPSPLIPSLHPIFNTALQECPKSPPPRLKDRKILSTTSSSKKMAGASHDDKPVSLCSTVDSSTEREHKSCVTTPVRGPVPYAPPPMFLSFPSPAREKDNSLRSCTSNPSTASVRSKRFPSASAYTQHRAHTFDMPVDISTLASPGPPPNKALPTPPSPSYSNASKSPIAAAGRRWGEADTASTTTTARPNTRDVTLSAESQELYHLTAECSIDSRESWGSWGGSGGGGPGVGSGSSKEASGGTNQLLEGDLERLAGRYH